jgi:hypothetical protein
MQQAYQMQQPQLPPMASSIYLSLIPMIASRQTDPDRVADEAWEVMRAAVKKLGIDIPERDESGDKP